MNDASLCGIVGCLQLGYIDNMAAHTGGCNETPISEAVEGIPMNCSAFVLLPSPMLASIFGAVIGAVEIGGDDFAIVSVVSI